MRHCIGRFNRNCRLIKHDLHVQNIESIGQIYNSVVVVLQHLLGKKSKCCEYESFALRFFVSKLSLYLIECVFVLMCHVGLFIF